MHIFKSFCLLLVFLTLQHHIIAQEQDKAYNFSVGMNINHFQGDFGWGLNITSPFLLKKKSMAFRAGAWYQYHQHVLVDSAATVYSPYAHFSLGWVGTSPIILNHIRLYTDTGADLALPNAAFSTQSVVWGIHSVLGFEFLVRAEEGKRGVGSYFAELGWRSLLGTADRLPNNPPYANGFSVSAGFRVHI